MEEPKAQLFDRHTPPHIVTLILVAGIGALTMNMHLPAMTDMANWFGTDYAIVQLSVSGYLAAIAVAQIFIGPLSDRFGRRPVFLISMVILAVASLICAYAPSIEIMLMARMAQTAAASGMVLSRAVVRDMVPMDRAASMIGYVTMGMTLIPMLAPIAGGTLSDRFGWQSIFIAQAVISVVVGLFAFLDMGETNKNPSSSFGSQFRSWPELFRSRRFWGYTLTATFNAGAYYCFLGGAPFVGINLLGLTPTELGYQFAYMAVGYMVGNFLSGRFATRVGVNRFVVIGSIFTSSGIVASMIFLFAGFQTPLFFFGPLLVMGFGNGMTLPNANAGIVSVRPKLAGSASGLGGSVTIAGGSALATLAGASLDVNTGAYPLLAIMLMSGLLALSAAIYVVVIDRREGSLVEHANG